MQVLKVCVEFSVRVGARGNPSVSVSDLLVDTAVEWGKAHLTAVPAEDAADQPLGNTQEHADEAPHWTRALH